MKKAFSIIVLLVIIFLGCSKTPTGKINDLYNQGLADLENFQFESALKKFQEIITIDSSSAMGIHGQGLVFEYKLQYYDALAVYLKLNFDEPDFILAYESAFRIFTHLEYYEDAAEISAKLQKNKSDKYLSIITEGLSLKNLEQYKTAIIKFRQALNINSDSTDKIQLLIASCFLLEGQIDSAQYIYNQVTINISSSSEAYSEAADYMIEAGYLDSAIALSRKSIINNDNSYQSMLKHFYRSLQIRYFYEARQVIAQLTDKELDSVAVYALNLIYHLAADNKNDSRIAGEVYRHNDAKSLSSLIYDMKARRIIVDELGLLQDYNAINAMKLDSTICPKFSEFYKYVAFKIYSHIPDYHDIEKMEAFTSMRTSTKDVILSLTQKQYFKINRENALIKLKELGRLHAGEPDWLAGMADFYRHKGVRLYDESEQLYKKALEINPAYKPAFINMIELKLTQKDFKQALIISEQYDNLVRNNPELELLKIKLLLLNNQFDDAIALLNNNVQHISNRIDYYKDYYKILEKADRSDETDKFIQLIESINEKNPDILVFLSKHYNNKNNYPKAIELAKAVITLEPNYADAHAEIARATFYQGQKEEAIKQFEKNILDFRFNPANYEYYSRILAEENIDMKRAANMARQANSFSSGGIDQMLNLCYVYKLTGRHDLSLGEARRVLNFNRENPELYYYIGSALYKLKRENYKNITKENLSKAIDLGLKGTQKEEAEFILSHL